MNTLLLMGVIAILGIVCLLIFSLWEQELKQLNELHAEIAWLELSLEEALQKQGEMIEIAKYYKQGMEEVLEHNVKLLKAMNKRGGVNR